MSEQNVNAVEQDNGGETDAGVPKTLFKTIEEANAAKPEGFDKHRVFSVLRDGEVVGYAWARQPNAALAIAAKAHGYAASVSEKKTAPVTKEVVAAKLASFSDEELAALGLSRKKGKGK